MIIPWIVLGPPAIGLGFRALGRILKEIDKHGPPTAKPASGRSRASISRPKVASSSAIPPTAPPVPVICLVGRTSAGKSSLGNALTSQAAFAVGVEHGTTSEIHRIPFRGRHHLQDTPGLLDGQTCSRVVVDAAKASELVILVTTGQLYRQELDFLRELCTSQRAWNCVRGSRAARSTLIFVNASDLKEATMPSGVRAAELSALREQVQDWVPGDYVLTGAAAPSDGTAAQVAALEARLEKFFEHAA